MRRTILLVAIAGLAVTMIGVQKRAEAGQTTPTATLSRTPTAIPSGVPLIVQGRIVFFHPSGLFSISQPTGWSQQEPYTDGGESAHAAAEAGQTFLNHEDFSVIHALVSLDPARPVANISDASAYIDNLYLQEAWGQYDSWKETGRRVESKRLTVNFALTFQGQPYLGRQITRVDHGWLVSLRIIVQVNNPRLVDDLDKVLWPTYNFYSDAAMSPIGWVSTVDPASGYLIKYPPEWARTNKIPNLPTAITGTTDGANFAIVPDVEVSATVKDEGAARRWVSTRYPTAKIITVLPEKRASATGFSLAFSLDDFFGKPVSAMAILLNGKVNGKTALISALYTVDIPNADLLKDTVNFPIAVQLRNSLIVFAPIALPQLFFPASPTTVPAPTTNPDSLSFDAAEETTSSDGVLGVKLPPDWTITERGDNSYALALGESDNPVILINITIADTETAYRGLNLPVEASTDPHVALEALKKAYPNLNFSDVTDASIGKYPGAGVTVKVADGSSADVITELRIGQLGPGQVIVATAIYRTNEANVDGPLVNSILGSIDVMVASIPSPTPSETPYDLQITATALQLQFNWLTESPTPSPTFTPSYTLTPTVTDTYTPSPTPTATHTPSPTNTASPTKTPTSSPTVIPTKAPTATSDNF